MAITQANVDALETALASGALTVSTPDAGSITYRSIADLKAALDYAKQQIAIAAGTAVSQSFASFDKG